MCMYMYACMNIHVLTHTLFHMYVHMHRCVCVQVLVKQDGDIYAEHLSHILISAYTLYI